MPFVPAAEDTDFATTTTNQEVVATGTNNMSSEPDSVPLSEWTEHPGFEILTICPRPVHDRTRHMQLEMHRAASGNAGFGHAHNLFDGMPDQYPVQSLPL